MQLSIGFGLLLTFLAGTAEEMSGQAMQLQELMAFFKVDTQAVPATQVAMHPNALRVQ